ncbi:MAG: PKD domain-containing protein [Anaerolineae bacterium]|nr:PKD domain-containing protein [Anaerolineae bacterium]
MLASTIEAPCTALDDVTIAGLTEGYTGTLYAFTAVITPADATPLITYTWSPQPDSGQGTDSAEYQWATPDTYTITLTAENCGGVVSDTHTITIKAEKWSVYLPLVVRGHDGLVLSKVEGLALKNRAPALNKTAVVTETMIRYDYDFAGNNPINGIPR